MSDLISRQAAINAIENTDCELSADAWDELTDAIMQLPSAQKKGEWIIQDGAVCCSECGEPNMEWNYCPSCGADMRGGDAT